MAVAALGTTVRQTRVFESAARRTSLAGIIELDYLHDTLMRMNRCGAVFVAALNGSALGFGAELSWACDLRLMADGDHFIGQPEVLLGFIPGGGGTQRLPRLVGAHTGLLAMLEGRAFSAREALEVGAIDELVAPARLLERAVEIARRLGSRPKPAVAAIKRSVYQGGSMGLGEGLQLERAEFLSVLGSEDAQQRMLEYLDRTEAEGELPFYDPAAYAEALDEGRLPGAGGDVERERRASVRIRT